MLRAEHLEQKYCTVLCPTPWTDTHTAPRPDGPGDGRGQGRGTRDDQHVDRTGGESGRRSTVDAKNEIETHTTRDTAHSHTAQPTDEIRSTSVAPNTPSDIPYLYTGYTATQGHMVLSGVSHKVQDTGRPGTRRSTHTHETYIADASGPTK